MRDLTVEEIDQVEVDQPDSRCCFQCIVIRNSDAVDRNKTYLKWFCGCTNPWCRDLWIWLTRRHNDRVANIARQVHATAIGSLSGASASNIVTGNGGGEGEASTLHRLEK